MKGTTTVDKLLLTVTEAAALLGISRSKIYHLIQTGELDSIKVGQLRRIPNIAAEEYVERKLTEARDAVA